MRLELKDLPPYYRAQAERLLAEQEKSRGRGKSTGDPLMEAVKQAQKMGRDFDSLGEYEFYIGAVLPKLATGEIKTWAQHPRFLLFPAGEYGGLKLGAIHYTADFRLDYADGTVEIVEVKSKFVRRMQRDYPVRRRIFIEQVARPAGWKFREIITADSKEEINSWRALAKETK